MGISQAEYEDLQSRHRRVCLIQGGGQEVVIRAPTRAEYKVARAAVHDPRQIADAQEDLVRKLVVYCNGVSGDWATVVAAFDAMLETYPGFCESKVVGSKVNEFTGIEMANSGKG